MNVYKNGDDYISYHRDKETGWVEGTGFATLSFGAERDFMVKNENTGDILTILHKQGSLIYMPYPMNHYCLHAVPKRKKVKGTRISLTFREVVG